jgi:general secretion pathway protein H
LTKTLPTTGGSRGFTLIEVVAVLFIVGVMAAFAVIAIGDGGHDRIMEQEARRLASLLELARDEGILIAETQAVGFTRQGYVFLRQYRVDERSYEWLPVEGDPVLRTRDLADRNVELTLYVEGVEVALPRTTDQPRPHVYLGLAGEMTPFQVDIAPEGGRTPAWRVLSLPGGRIEMRRP